MRTTHTFSIDFFKRSCRGKRKKGKAHIYARIWVDGQPSEISLKEELDAADWDANREMVRGKSIQAKSFNSYIDDIRAKIKAKYRELEVAELLITAQSVKEAYLGIQNALKGHKLVELLDYYCKIWKPKLKRGGFKNITTTVAYVKNFLKSICSSGDVYLSQVNMVFATDLEHYIRNHPIKKHDPCEGNGLAKHLQRFKRILSWAKEIEWIKMHPCEDYSCKQVKSKRKKLSIKQLFTLEKQAFADTTIDFVKDLFLNSCYAGFAFAEAMELKEDHFEWNTDGRVWCMIYRMKSDELTAVPILSYAARILNKYRARRDYVPGKPIFPKITNQEVNRCLKIIQAVCGIQFTLTFHIARHTFATTVALKNGIPIETVQLMMGHTKITTTKIYAEVDEEKIEEDTVGWEEKIDRKMEIVQAAQLMQERSGQIAGWAK